MLYTSTTCMVKEDYVIDVEEKNDKESKCLQQF